mmetsp:Transcript_22325/g.37347  ORF Transcript_22325/g.37347 Transcript_22325/m.37347 type:complete len:394 (+) Transcript_22325:92-1273(+)
MLTATVFQALAMLTTIFLTGKSASGDHHSLVDPIITACELEALSVGTRLADHYQSYDEATEWDVRIHDDYLVQYLGFAGWIQLGLYKNTHLTATKQDTHKLHQRGGWVGHNNVSQSAYWPFNNKWVYMMGDSTQRQIWATFVSPFQNNDFERNAKEWTRERCDRQYPHRKNHPAGDYFEDEGWGGKCGNNELTCHLSGFGPQGRITFDWKHFPYEDYDQWLFGESGFWNGTARFPEVLVIHTGLHTCVHSWFSPTASNHSMIRKHKEDLKPMMKLIRTAIDRTPAHLPRTRVIIQLPGRAYNGQQSQDHCTRTFNRVAAYEAHLQGFAVLEREEIERRLLYKSEFWDGVSYMKPILHLENPATNIVGTSLLSLVGCLERNGGNFNTQYRAEDV